MGMGIKAVLSPERVTLGQATSGQIPVGRALSPAQGSAPEEAAVWGSRRGSGSPPSLRGDGAAQPPLTDTGPTPGRSGVKPDHPCWGDLRSFVAKTAG